MKREDEQATGLFTVSESISRITRRSIRVSLWPDCFCCTTSPLTLTACSKRVWSAFAEQSRPSLPPNFPLVIFCRLLCELFPSAESETVGSGQEQNGDKRTSLPQRLLSWLKVWDPEEDTSSWPAAPHLRPSADQLPDWLTDWLAVCVSRGPEWQSSIQPEAGTAG